MASDDLLSTLTQSFEFAKSDLPKLAHARENCGNSGMLNSPVKVPGGTGPPFD